MRRTQIYLDETLYSLLRRESKKEGKTVSEILRLAEEAANEEGLATKAKEKLKKISSLLEKRIRSTKKGELLYTIIAGL